MVKWGNKRAARYWQRNVPPGYHIPDEADSVATVEKWIRDKYERKLFVPRPGQEDPTADGEDNPAEDIERDSESCPRWT